jgi:hypothetical protein
MFLYPIPRYPGLSFDMFVTLLNESITKIRGFHAPSSLHMGQFALGVEKLIGTLCIPLANSKGGHS